MSDEMTTYLQRLRQGRDDEAAAELWVEYFEKLLSVARRNLGSLPKRVADEEDVAVSAMNSFFVAAESGRFADLGNREELWKLLITIVIRKTNRFKERAVAQKRGSGTVRGESIFENQQGESSAGLAGIPDQPFSSVLMEHCGELLENLNDDTLKEIAVLRLQGYTVSEISKKMALARSTVKRKLALVKNEWHEISDGDYGAGQS